MLEIENDYFEVNELLRLLNLLHPLKIIKGNNLENLILSCKEKSCDRCNSSHPSNHLSEFEGKHYCCFCFGDIQEEKANWSE